MEYRLAIYNEDKYMDIKGYSNILKNNELDETKLEDIVKFTNSFYDENQLKQVLLYMGLISEKELDGYFAINFYRGKTSAVKALNYGISYKSDKDFFNYSYLLLYYLTKQNNPEFMNRFLNKYFDYLKDKSIFSDLYFINFSNNELKKYGYLPSDANDAFERFIRNYCLKKDKSGKYVVSFARLRDLAMFAIDYKKSLTVSNEKTRSEEMLNNFPKTINNNAIEMSLDHFQTMLKESPITDEQREEYEQEVMKLERKLKDN